MARGVNGCLIYHDDEDRRYFLGLLGRIERSTGAEVIAYCLMNNHFHLAVKIGLVPLSSVMQRAQTGYAQRINEKYGRTGHLFQARYKAKLCLDDKYLRRIIQYVHKNPVRAGLVVSPADWPWSSYSLHPVIPDELGEFDPWGEELAESLIRQEDVALPIEFIGTEAAERHGISVELLRSRTKERAIVSVKRIVAREAVAVGHSMTDIARWLNSGRATITRYCTAQIGKSTGLTPS